MHVHSRLKTTLKLVLAVAFALAPLNSYSAPPTAANDNHPRPVAANDNQAAANDNNQQQSFLTTENIPTSQGPAHLEVQTYTIRNEADLTRAKNEILDKLRTNSRSHDLFRLNVVTSDHVANNLDSSTRVALDQIESTIISSHKDATQNISVAPPDKAGFFKRHYNLTLSFVRFVANTGVVSTGLIMGAGVAAPHAILIGALAGAMSGTIQLKSDVLMKWLSNSVLLVSTAKKLGLLKANEGAEPSRAERVMKEMEMYGRWATLEAAFLIVV
jgi:hypothetical protein